MASSTDIEPPHVLRSFRGVWVASVDHIDFPSRTGMSVVEQQVELGAIVENCANQNFNAIIFQVRPAGDALYETNLEPWSEFLTGRQGQAPEPLWDPLRQAIELCHARGMELHAWFNPFRAFHPSAKGPLAATHFATRNPQWVYKYGTNQWMDPGIPEVRRHSLNVILDVVRRFDVDGIHLDDYFYPYPVSGKAFPDDKTYKSYLADNSDSKGKLGLSDWRRRNCDRFVQALYREVKKIKPWVKVGISPFGIYRPGVPAGIEANLDQYAQLYADPVKWLRNGWVDYLSPQLYWKIDPAPQSFPKLLNWWASQNIKKRHLWPGLFASRVMKEFGDWPTDELVRQIQTIEDSGTSDGQVLFSYRALRSGQKRFPSALQDNAGFQQPCLLPASTWLDSRRPERPTFKENAVISDVIEISLKSKDLSVIRFALYGRDRTGSDWRLLQVNDGSKLRLDRKRQYAAACLDRCWNQSPMTILNPKAASSR